MNWATKGESGKGMVREVVATLPTTNKLTVCVLSIHTDIHNILYILIWNDQRGCFQHVYLTCRLVHTSIPTIDRRLSYPWSLYNYILVYVGLSRYGWWWCCDRASRKLYLTRENWHCFHTQPTHGAYVQRPPKYYFRTKSTHGIWKKARSKLRSRSIHRSSDHDKSRAAKTRGVRSKTERVDDVILREDRETGQELGREGGWGRPVTNKHSDNRRPNTANYPYTISYKHNIRKKAHREKYY